MIVEWVKPFSFTNETELDIQISVIVEFVAGRTTEMLLKMIALYRPDCKLPHYSQS